MLNRLITNLFVERVRSKSKAGARQVKNLQTRQRCATNSPHIVGTVVQSCWRQRLRASHTLEWKPMKISKYKSWGDVRTTESTKFDKRSLERTWGRFDEFPHPNPDAAESTQRVMYMYIILKSRRTFLFSLWKPTTRNRSSGKHDATAA